MKKIILIIIIIFSIQIKAGTVINTSHFDNQTVNWNKEGSPYIIKGSVGFSSSTLNIDNAEIIFYKSELYAFYDSSINFSNNSQVNIVNSKIKNIDSSKIIFGLFDSVLNINNLEINTSEFLQAYNSNINISGLKSINDSNTNSLNKNLFHLYSNTNLSFKDSYIDSYKGTVFWLFNTDTLNIKHNLFSNNKKVFELHYANKAYINNNDFEGNDIAILSHMHEFTDPYINIEDNYFQKDFKKIYLYENQSDINEVNRLIGPFKINIFSEFKNINNYICCSNIIFLPGIMTSRLYIDELTQNQLWEPNRNTDVKKLFLNTLGQSIYNVYTKDIIGITNLIFSNKYIDRNVYNDFFLYLKSLKDDKDINEYKLIPYDWRMSIESIINDNNIIQSIKDLQKTSKTGKVSIITHSNGGLVVKALIKELEKQNSSDLIDNVIFVAMPEYGTPQAITSLLYGHNQSILNGLILKSSIANALGVNMPSAYNLLPSDKYFQNKNIDKEKVYRTLLSYTKFNKFLFDKSKEFHNEIDNIIYPTNINVYQILGTGLNTVYDFSVKDDKVTPLYDKNGDGTVQDMSATRYGTTTYIDLKDTIYKHINIMNNKNVLSNINNIIKSSNKNTYIGLDYNKIVKDNNYKMIQINGNDLNLELSINKNQLYLDKINVNNINNMINFAEIVESVNSKNRFELSDKSINYLYSDKFDNFIIDSKTDNEIDISIIESIDGSLEQLNFDNVKLFKDMKMKFEIDENNSLRLNLSETGHTIEYRDIDSINKLSLDDILLQLKSSNTTKYLKDRYIRRLEKYRTYQNKDYIEFLKKAVNDAIHSINGLSYSGRLRARYAILKEDYVYLRHLLLNL